MQAVIDLPEEQIEPLNTLAASLELSRTELIRRAVADYLRRFEPTTEDVAFGIWQQRNEDGLEDQARLRSEWGR